MAHIFRSTTITEEIRAHLAVGDAIVHNGPTVFAITKLGGSVNARLYVDNVYTLSYIALTEDVALPVLRDGNVWEFDFKVAAVATVVDGVFVNIKNLEQFLAGFELKGSIAIDGVCWHNCQYMRAGITRSLHRNVHLLAEMLVLSFDMSMYAIGSTPPVIVCVPAGSPIDEAAKMAFRRHPRKNNNQK